MVEIGFTRTIYSSEFFDGQWRSSRLLTQAPFQELYVCTDIY